MNLKTCALALVAAAAGPALADEPPQPAPGRVPHLDHAFVIVMENHQYSQILGNKNAPFTNQYATQTASLAANYFGIGHPSLTNYLEIVGGSNFGVRNDNSPDWHNAGCTPNIVTNDSVNGNPALEGAPAICPIAGKGYDAPTPQLDTNEGSIAQPIYNDPLFFPTAFPVTGASIADQLESQGLTWKSYQENLPPFGADKVNNSDGLLADTVGAGFKALPKLYAVKHNPFVYFRSVQEGGLRNIVDFGRLYRDLRSGDVPNLLFIAPNQCHDQHGRSSKEVGYGCNYNAVASYDPNTSNVSFSSDPSQLLIAQGDAALSNLVSAIKASPAWSDGNSAIVVVWDENDYAPGPGVTNQVVTTVETNYRRSPRVTSTVQYSHFALFKTLEAAFGLPFINHAADPNTPVMTDLFGR